MKKTSTILSLAAAVGIVAMTGTSAGAVTGPYPNCSAAAAVGVYNIPAGAPGYAPYLDRDHDGIACENPNVPYRPEPAAQTGSTNQIARVPVGGAATGVTQESRGSLPQETPLGTFVLGGGLVIAAAAGGTFLFRRAKDSRS